jgi:hypothetical protein
VEEPNIFARPFDIPINPKKINADNGVLKKIKTKAENNNGMFIKINNFLLVNLSIKKPEPRRVITDKIEYTMNDWAIMNVPHSLDSVIND